MQTTFWTDLKRLATTGSIAIFGAGVGLGVLLSASVTALLAVILASSAILVHVRIHARESFALIAHADAARAETRRYQDIYE